MGVQERVGNHRGPSRQHLVLARGSSGAARVVPFDVAPGADGWQRLFQKAPATVPMAAYELVLNPDVSEAVHAMIAGRIANELGGRASFERTLDPSLDAGEAEPLDVVVMGSALAVVPSGLDASSKDVFYASLTFAHAAAGRREQTERDGAAYGGAYLEGLSAAGWLMSASAADQAPARSNLLTTMTPSPGCAPSP